MVLGKAICDSYGNSVLDQGIPLRPEDIDKLAIYSVREVLIEDWLVADVLVQPLIAPELEAQAIQALRQLLTESQGSPQIDDTLLEQVEEPVYAMVRELFPEVVGEVSAAGCSSAQEFRYVQPVKAAELALLMGRKAGLRMADLAGLGLATLLMDVGLIMLPEGDPQATRRHPERGAAILSQCKRLGPDMVVTVLQHHERWDGSGYPRGLKSDAISLSARILAVADSYYELVSERPERHSFMPHEAVEFIMAYSGELFDPSLVRSFARQVPLYPTGVAVKTRHVRSCHRV